MSLVPGIIGQKTELTDGVKVDSITELIPGNGVVVTGAFSTTGILGSQGAYTPTVTNEGSVGFTKNFYYHKLGTVLHLCGTLYAQNNGSGASFVYFSLPTGLLGITGTYPGGFGGRTRASGPNNPEMVYVVCDGSNNFYLRWQYAGGTANLVANDFGPIDNTSRFYTVFLSLIIPLA